MARIVALDVCNADLFLFCYRLLNSKIFLIVYACTPFLLQNMQ